MIGGAPTLNQVQLLPSKGGPPTVTTNGGDLVITSATGRVIIDGVLQANLQNSYFFTPPSTTASNVFTAGIFVSGVASVFSASVTISTGNLAILTGTLSVGGAATITSDLTVKTGNVSVQTGTISAANVIYTSNQVQVGDKGYFGLNAANHIVLSGSAGDPFMAADSSGGASNLAIRSHGTGQIKLQTQDGSATQVIVDNITSAVNYQRLIGNTTGNSPATYYEGTDANVGGLFIAKGAGSFGFFTGAGARGQVIISDGAGTDILTLTSGSTAASVGSTAGDVKIAPASTYVQIGQTFGAAAVPASFSAVEIWTIKNAAGNLRYVGVATATW